MLRSAFIIVAALFAAGLRILVIWYEPGAASEAKIEGIRAAYKLPIRTA